MKKLQNHLNTIDKLAKSFSERIHFESKNVYVNLTRANRPIGILLLVLPILWFLAFLSYSCISFLFWCFYFILGAFVSRSAGCIINDMLDKKFDLFVERTKNRPIASKQISVKKSFLILLLYLLIAFVMVVFLPIKALYLGFVMVLGMAIYPITKRYTHYAQVILGIVFNSGIFIAYIAIDQQNILITIILYVSSIFWTIGYDTIYALQDYKYDQDLNLKSLAILWKKSPHQKIWLMYEISIGLLAVSGFLSRVNLIFYLILAFAGFIIHAQIEKLEIEDPKNSKIIFDLNALYGIIVLFGIIIGRI